MKYTGFLLCATTVAVMCLLMSGCGNESAPTYYSLPPAGTGGGGNTGGGTGTGSGPPTSTSTVPTGIWQKANPASKPGGLSYHTMAWDGTGILLYGGIDGVGNARNDTYRYDGTTWRKSGGANPTSARYYTRIAWDGAQVVMFGGFVTDPDNASRSVPTDETWLWDGSDWTKASLTGSPPPRADHVLTWTGSQVILFGGLGEDNILGDTWEWTGSGWRELSPSTKPAPRFAGGFGGPFIHGGRINSRGGVSSDVYYWNGADWIDRTPAGNLNTLENHFFYTESMGFHFALGIGVRFGGYTGTSTAGLTCEFHTDRWIVQNDEPKPIPVTYNGNMAYDPVREVLVFFGGANNQDGWLNQTWEYKARQ
ncbi:MAG: hypothetical protein E3J72_22570 [Planctomycetota bacterium]|nr:MAG: hypothetical protein E3J72_22570 [Planctomycetota bacterium]